jgi:DNA-directed RNA polymerase subunit omega
MASRQDTMMNPSIEQLLDRAGSKFSLVTLSAMRARQINAYFNQLGEGLGAIIPPQVTSVARKPLSIAFEEIAGDKIVLAQPSEAAPDEPEAAASVEVAEADQSGDGSENDGAE